MKDIPSRGATKPARSESAGRAGERARTVVLGLNLWAILVLWPWLGSRSASAVELGVGLSAPLWLLLGASRPSAARAPFLRPLCWLCAFPAALATSLSVRPEHANQELFGPLAIVLVWLSTCAYGASAAFAARSRGEALETTHHELEREPWDAPPPEGRAWLRRAFATCSVVGAAALALLAPTLGGREALERAWGDASASGGVLTAVAGAALGVSVLAIYLGEGLRGGREPAHEDASMRTAWLLFLTLLGGVTYYVTQP